MEDAIFESILNFGIFPAVTIYLMFVIIKDFKNEIKAVKSVNEEELKISINQFNNIINSLNKLIDINENTQSYLTNYLNTLLIKLLDVLDDKK